MRSWFIVVAFAVGLAGTACATEPRSLTDPSASPTPSEPSEPSESPTPSPSETEFEWKTFVEPRTGVTIQYPPTFVVGDDGSPGETGFHRVYAFVDERFIGPGLPEGLISLAIFDFDASGIAQWLSKHSSSGEEEIDGDFFINVSGRSDATFLGRDAVEFDWAPGDGSQDHTIIVAHGRYVLALSWQSEGPDYKAEIRGVFESMRDRVRE